MPTKALLRVQGWSYSHLGIKGEEDYTASSDSFCFYQIST